MKKFLQIVFINAVTLSFVAFLFGGFSYNNQLLVLFFAAFIFALINFYLQPIIKIFFLPINILTLGMFRWLVGVVCLLVLTIIIPEIEVRSFQFPGLEYSGFVIPSFYFNTTLSLISSSLLISLTSSLIHWLFKK